MDSGFYKKEILARVQRGAELLDEKLPGWERKIDLGTLEISNPCLCVLGQAFGEFTGGLGLLQLGLGFFIGLNVLFPDDYSCEYLYGFDAQKPGDLALLQDAWVELIKDRFSSGDLSG